MSQGYPDFQRVAQRIGAPLVDVTSDPVSAAHDYGPVYVGTWPAVVLSARELTSKTATVTLFWLSANDTTKQLVAEQYVYTGGVDFHIVRPVAAPWVVVEVFEVTGGASTWTLSLTPTSNVPAVSDSLDNPLVIDVPPTPVAIAGVLTTTGSALRSGAAVLSYLTGGAAFELELQRIGVSGTWSRVLDVVSTAAMLGDTMEVALPRSVVRLVVTNGSGAVHSVSATLIGR